MREGRARRRDSILGKDPTEFFLTDPLNSVVAIADSSGTINTSCTYEPYGYSQQGCDFTGRENDGDGPYFMRNRYYAPELGRFISRDPSGVAGGVNIYEYAGDNPTKFTDPLGPDYGNGEFGFFGEGYYGYAGSGGLPGGYQGGGIGWAGLTLLVSQGGLGSDIIPMYHGQNGGGMSDILEISLNRRTPTPSPEPDPTPDKTPENTPGARRTPGPTTKASPKHTRWSGTTFSLCLGCTST